MKILKPILLSILLHLYIQIDILIQTKLYDQNMYFDGWLALPIIFAIAVYWIFRSLCKKEFWTALVSFVIIYAIFVYIGRTTDYFIWLLNLTNLSTYYDRSINYYELGINASADGLLHTIAFAISSVVYLIRHRKTK